MDTSEFLEHIHSTEDVQEAHRPFFLQAGPASPAALLVHGFTANPEEMREIAEYLHGRGTTCLAVRLPGHATNPEDLAGRTWEEWLEAVEQGFLFLSEFSDRIYGVGMSTGSLLLLALAMKQDPAGLVLCSPYLKVQHRLAAHAGWLRYFRPYHMSPRTETRAGYYNKRPLAGVHQINRLIRLVKRHLRDITVPVLAMNGAGDATIEIDSGRQLYAELGSELKIYLRFGPEAPHVLTGRENPHQESVFALTHWFIRALEAHK